MKTVIVIPARYGSTRFPGKPLVEIGGRAMLHRVIDVARRAGHAAQADVLVATDDERVVAAAGAVGACAVMTDENLASGTDRALAALEAVDSDADFIINLQGDAPFTPPHHITALIQAAAGDNASADVVTPVVRLTWESLDMLRRQKEKQPFSGTTCVRDEAGRALWFSKTIIPAIRHEEALRKAGAMSPVLRHIGLYGYRRAALKRYVSLPVSPHERLEGLEQLRFLENGMRIDAIEVDAADISMTGIDTADDVALAEQLLQEKGDPFGGARDD